jgi:hypothetical protein
MTPEQDTRPELHDVEKVTDSCRENSALVLSEEQALAKARSSPDDALPIVIAYGVDDVDNPRNWPKWRKWYITIVVSMLNVFTYVIVQWFFLFFSITPLTAWM